ncbi:helix-turn-helix transcriptional regulator [Denitromonas sp.]|uniref:helix-turn-helix domain-containing protein n=1 Tax=Denitromonas sp. TaxID=2734609 RepID=UPI002AFDF866|nr:helix-turn-helix transcriptional regulator [Denitromonas sp.]
MRDATHEALCLDFAIKLRHARNASGLSQEALALAANVDRTYVSQLERGVANPSLLILGRIARALNAELVIALQPSEAPE